MTYLKIRSLVKFFFLLIVDTTTRSRFFFWGEYRRWKNLREEKRTNETVGKNETRGNGVCYLVPGVGISGGIAVVFQHANRLQKKGVEVKILSLNEKNDDRWFPCQSVEVIPFKKTKELLQSGKINILIATGYSTAFTADMAKARRKIYFVQSDESRFFPKDKKLCKIIRETYKLPFEYMTEAKWIQGWLKEEYGHDAFYVPNGIDSGMFHRVDSFSQRKSKQRVLIEGGINIPYKGMDDAYEVVKNLDAELWIISNNGKPKTGWRYDRFFKNIPIDEMKNIYSACDILLKMSRVEGFFGPPMEAMACGCAVVTGKVTGYDEYIVDGENALVVERGDIDGAKKAVERLINDPILREKLVTNGYETVQKWSWDRSIALLEKVITRG